MNIDWNIAQVFILIAGIFFILGAPLKWKMPQIPFLCLPAIGLIVFGGIITPILYFTGGWHLYILYIAVAILLGLGLASLFLIIKTLRPAKPTLFSAVMFALLILIVAGFIIQSSKYPVPGGIDPAIHASYISSIVQNNDFKISYPLGMHIFALFIENISSHSTPTILLALQIFFIVNIFIITYYLIKIISNNKIAGMIGSLAIILDVSIYNNYLNGSITHLLAILLILIGIMLTLLLPNNSKRLNFLVITMFYVSVFYFHFITLFILIPILWCLRVCRVNNQHWLFVLAFPASLLVAAPLLKNFLNIPGFQIQFIGACLIFLLVEVVILFFSSHIKKILFNIWAQLLFAVIGLLAFKNTLKAFDVIPEWYELFILSLAIMGIVLIILKRLRDWYPIVMYFSIFSILYYLIDFASAHIESPIFKELIFYYGFTVPLVLLGAAGIYYGLQLVSSKAVKTSALAALLIIIILIFGSRFFDKTFLSDARAISRYGQNNGFGMFYSNDDVQVAEWAKEHLPKDAGIINPGGLYNTWASITERRVMYARAEINSEESEKTHQAVVNLLNSQDIGCPQQLTKQKYQYLLLPSQYVIYFQNPCVNLIYKSGAARLYKINDQITATVKSQAINLDDLTQNKNISISGDFGTVCTHCNNRFYYQFKNVGRAIRIPANGMMYITIAQADYNRNINLIVLTQNPRLTVTIIGKNEEGFKYSKLLSSNWAESTERYVLQNYAQRKGEEIRVQLENTNEIFIDIQAIIFDIF